jgi:hypothetical protein
VHGVLSRDSGDGIENGFFHRAIAPLIGKLCNLDWPGSYFTAKFERYLVAANS